MTIAPFATAASPLPRAPAGRCWSDWCAAPATIPPASALAIGLRIMNPALQTSASSRPSVAAISASNCWTCASSPTSAAMNRAPMASASVRRAGSISATTTHSRRQSAAARCLHRCRARHRTPARPVWMNAWSAPNPPPPDTRAGTPGFHGGRGSRCRPASGGATRPSAIALGHVALPQADEVVRRGLRASRIATSPRAAASARNRASAACTCAGACLVERLGQRPVLHQHAHQHMAHRDDARTEDQCRAGRSRTPPASAPDRASRRSRPGRSARATIWSQMARTTAPNSAALSWKCP